VNDIENCGNWTVGRLRKWWLKVGLLVTHLPFGKMRRRTGYRSKPIAKRYLWTIEAARAWIYLSTNTAAHLSQYKWNSHGADVLRTPHWWSSDRKPVESQSLLSVFSAERRPVETVGKHERTQRPVFHAVCRIERPISWNNKLMHRTASPSTTWPPTVWMCGLIVDNVRIWSVLSILAYQWPSGVSSRSCAVGSSYLLIHPWSFTCAITSHDLLFNQRSRCY